MFLSTNDISKIFSLIPIRIISGREIIVDNFNSFVMEVKLIKSQSWIMTFRLC